MKKTSISFGLVNIPVQMRPIIKNNDVSFNQLHKKCGARINYVKYCPSCKKDVKADEIIKGYKYATDSYVTLSNEEFNNLKSPDEKMLEIIGFVDLKEIDPVFYEKSYVLDVESKNKAYSLFKAALEKTKMVAIAKTVMNTKFYYVVIRLKDDVLVMNTLYFKEEVLIPEKVTEAAYTKKELDLAVELINSLKTKFDPENYIDEYQIKVKEAIEKKIDGKAIPKVKQKKKNNIKDLMTALEMSLKNV